MEANAKNKEINKWESRTNADNLAIANININLSEMLDRKIRVKLQQLSIDKSDCNI